MGYRIRLNDEQKLDEVVGENVSLHLEQMDNNEWWMRVEDQEGRAVHVWLSAKRATVHAAFDEEPPAPEPTD